MRLELRLTAETPVGPMWTLPAFRLVRMAVAVGFEPTEACTSHAFEACSFGRSDTLPLTSLQEADGGGPGGTNRFDCPERAFPPRG